MIEMFDKEAGSDNATHKEEPMLLLNVGVPAVVRVPDHPGLPGGVRKCYDVIPGPCKVPGHDHQARHYVLAGPVWCCECVVAKVHQWYLTPPNGERFIKEQYGGEDGPGTGSLAEGPG